MIVYQNTSEKESIDSLLRRFKKQVKKEGILQECRKREFFLKNHWQEKKNLKEQELLERRNNHGEKKH